MQTPPDLRDVMRSFATGVCVATTFVDGSVGREHDAVTINSFTSVSLDPPRVSMCLRGDSGFLADLRRTGAWGVSVLDAGAEDLVKVFAGSRQARVAGIRTLSAVTGSLTGCLILDAPSWMECSLYAELEIGDRVMVIGDVVAAGSQQRRPPLIFLDGGLHTLDRP